MQDTRGVEGYLSRRRSLEVKDAHHEHFKKLKQNYIGSRLK